MSATEHFREQMKKQVERLNAAKRFDERSPAIVTAATVIMLIVMMFWDSPLALVVYAIMIPALSTLPWAHR